MKPDIIFIGAGPIGLLGAIQLKLQCPDKHILMFEKYDKPKRAHAMYVKQESFAGMDRSNGFGDILDAIPPKEIISDLEKKLRAFAEEKGIEIKYQEINDFNALQKEYPDTRYFVGSGGLRGIIHPQVFINKDQINKILKYAVEVKYKAEGEAQPLGNTKLPAVLATTKHSSIFSKIKREDPLSYYQRKVQELVTEEIGTIHGLDFGLDMIQSTVAPSRIFPAISSAGLYLRTGGKQFLEEAHRARHEQRKDKDDKQDQAESSSSSYGI